MSTTFSVIIALYNCEPYIEACLTSLVGQTHRDFEAIVVDDCSTDDGLAVARACVEGDARFRFLQMERNSGQGAARNRALAEARGDVIVLLDADDMLAVHALERIAARFERQQLDDLYFNATSFYEDAEAYRCVVEDFSQRASFDDVATGTELFTFFEQRDQFFAHGALHAVTRDLVESAHIRFPEGVIHEDLLFTFQILVAAQRSSFLNEPLYERRIRAGSTMAQPRRTMHNVKGHLVSVRWMERWMDVHVDVLDPSFVEAMAHRLSKYLEICAYDYLTNVTDDEKAAYLAALTPREALAFQMDVVQRAALMREMYESKTWRVGNAVVAIPRRLRDGLKALLRKKG